MDHDDCVFCRIINRKEKSFIIFEDKESICFLDKRPLFFGHCLLLPKRHLPTLQDIPSPLLHVLFDQTKLLARAVEKGMQAEGSFIAMNNVVSQSVPHFHIHIVPRNKGDGLRGFFWPRTTYASEEEMLTVQERISMYVINKS